MSTQISFIWLRDRSLSGASNPSQSEPGSNGSKRGTLHYWNLTIRLFCVISRKLLSGVLPPCRDAVNVFYSPSLRDHFCRDAVGVFNSLNWLGCLKISISLMYLYVIILLPTVMSKFYLSFVSLLCKKSFTVITVLIEKEIIFLS